MPKLDRYGSQPPIELLRQFQDFSGFYDRNKFFWKEIQVQIYTNKLSLIIMAALREISFLAVFYYYHLPPLRN